MSASISQLAFPIDERQLSRTETPKVEETAVCSETDVDESGRFSFASRSMMVKKMENNVGARTQPCLTPLQMGKLPDRDPLCFI